MGLSRNKVAVSEGAAGSPPFYGERVIWRNRILRSLDFDERCNGLVLFNIQGSRILEEKSVLQTQRVHLYPFRTQKLSSAVVKILYGRLYGKIAQCRHGEGTGNRSLSRKIGGKAKTFFYE